MLAERWGTVGRSSLLPEGCVPPPSSPSHPFPVLPEAAQLLLVGRLSTLATGQFPPRLPLSGPYSCCLLTGQ